MVPHDMLFCAPLFLGCTGLHTALQIQVKEGERWAGDALFKNSPHTLSVNGKAPLSIKVASVYEWASKLELRERERVQQMDSAGYLTLLPEGHFVVIMYVHTVRGHPHKKV